jgi:hypothetical protein
MDAGMTDEEWLGLAIGGTALFGVAFLLHVSIVMVWRWKAKRQCVIHPVDEPCLQCRINEAFRRYEEFTKKYVLE